MTLKDAFRDQFLIGTALNSQTLQGNECSSAELARTHFNAFTAENSMKPEALQRLKGQFTFAEADAMIEIAEEVGATPIGHTLVWHSQTPAWFTQESGGQPLSRQLALKHMHDHIATVVGRYKGRVKQWDVVNEAISDEGEQILRDSPWLRAIGDDYIAEAFRTAHRADPDAILIYNDYGNESGSKREKNLRLLESLLAQNVPIHAVGLQCHWRLDQMPLEETEESIDLYGSLGLKVMITELDIGVLPTHIKSADIAARDNSGTASDLYTTGLPEVVSERLALCYQQSYAMFLRNKEVVNRVTLWGISDGKSWLNNFPVPGRTDYPLLFDRRGNPKSAFFAVLSAATNALPNEISPALASKNEVAEEKRGFSASIF